MALIINHVEHRVTALERLGGRFVPRDANVHALTSQTLNLLRLLAANKPVFAYVYEETMRQSGAEKAL